MRAISRTKKQNMAVGKYKMRDVKEKRREKKKKITEEIAI